VSRRERRHDDGQRGGGSSEGLSLPRAYAIVGMCIAAALVFGALVYVLA
jgi:hypothetical protein